MYNYLYRYLLLHKKLFIPGIGGFIAEHTDAKIDFVDKIIYPQLPVINYTAEKISANADFLPSLSAYLQTDEVTAENKFADFSASLTKQISENGSLTLPGIGVLTKQFYNTYTFEPQQNVRALFPDIHAERVVRKNAEHTVRVGESEKSSVQMQEAILKEEPKQRRWWIPAAVLAVIGVIALVFY